MKHKSVKLYNVMFPLWFFFFFPTWLWGILLPANLGIDSLVLLVTLKKLGFTEKQDRKEIWKKRIWYVWMLGFLSDFLGAGVSLLLMMASDYVPFLGAIYDLPYIWMQIISAIPGVIVAGLMIYFFNRYLSFRKTDLTKEQIHKLALSLAIFTAPYTMLIPLYW